MSTLVMQEPSTSAKVILVTTHGELDIELWTKEAPKASRNFIQLCMEGYYDNNIFHRLIPGFMIQTGDPTGTGRGGESIYGEMFQDEFNQRLKFTHRGLVAMTNEEKPNTNGSQFFITLDSCSWIEKKHTIFGKIVGDTIYNLLNMANIDTDAEDRPINPPKILQSRVLINPFDDIIVRNRLKNAELDDDSDNEQQQKSSKQQKQQKQKKQKLKQNKNLLSFEDEDQQEQNDNFQMPLSKKGILSSHDVVNDPKLSKSSAVSEDDLLNQKKQQQIEEEKRKLLKQNIKQRNHGEQSDQLDNSQKDQIRKKLKLDGAEVEKYLTENQKNEKLNQYKIRKNKKTGKYEIYWDESSESDSGQNIKSNNNSSSSSSASSDEEQEEELDENKKMIREKQKQEYEHLKLEILQFKQEKLGTNNPIELDRIKHEKKLLTNLEKRKQQFFESQTSKAYELDKLNQLETFRKTINSDTVIGDRLHWMNHKLKFHIDSERAYKHIETKEKVRDYKIEDDEFSIVDTKNIQKDDNQQKHTVKLSDILSIDQLIDMTADKQ